MRALDAPQRCPSAHIGSARIPVSVRHTTPEGKRSHHPCSQPCRSRVVLTNDSRAHRLSINVAAKRVTRTPTVQRVHSIGRPFHNVASFVINPQPSSTANTRHQTTACTAGLCGVQVARGYLRRPEPTPSGSSLLRGPHRPVGPRRGVPEATACAGTRTASWSLAVGSTCR